MSLPEYLTYTYLRAEDDFRGFDSKQQVRRDIETWRHDEEYKVFSKGVSGTGPLFYLEIDRSQWGEIFGEGG